MFGIGNLFDPMKMSGMSLFGGPQPSGGPSWGPITPPGGKPPGMLDAPPNGMLRAGDDDMRPPPLPGGTGALNLAKAGGEGPLAPPNAGPSRGLSIGAAPPVESSAALHPPETAQGPAALTGRVPESTTPMTGITTPSLSPQYTPTPPQPGEGAGGLRTQYDAPAAAPAPAGGGAAGPGAATPSTAATATTGTGGMGKLGDIGKALSAAGGQQAGKAAGFAPGGVGAAHTPDGSALMAKIMEAQTVTPVGPVPGLPPGLLNRFRSG